MNCYRDQTRLATVPSRSYLYYHRHDAIFKTIPEDERINIRTKLSRQVLYKFEEAAGRLQRQYNKKSHVSKFQQSRFPIVQPEFCSNMSQFLPLPLENQWENRFQSPDYEFDHSVGKLFHFRFDIQAEMLQNLNTGNRDLPEAGQFIDLLTTASVTRAPEKVVLVFHDFYQTQYQVAHFLNHLENVHQVAAIAPSMQQLLANSPGRSWKTALPNLFKLIRLFGIQSYHIVAQGSGCDLANHLAKEDRRCDKMILCSPISPIVMFSPKKIDISPETIQLRNLSYEVSTASDLTICIEDVHCAEKGTAVDQEVSDQQSEISSVQLNSVLQLEKIPEDCIRSNPQAPVEMSSSVQHASSVSPGDAGSNNPRALQQQDAMFRTLEFYNELVEQIYRDRHVVLTTQHAFGAQRLKHLAFVSSAHQFCSIYNGMRSTKKTHRLFLQHLYSLLTFSPMPVTLAYQQAYPRQFYEQLQLFVHSGATLHLQNRRNTFLFIASHDCLLTEPNLRQIHEIHLKFNLVECRTVLGAGHDLLSCLGEILARMVR